MSIYTRLARLEQQQAQQATGPEPTHIVVQYGDDAWRPTQADYDEVNAAIRRDNLPAIVVWHEDDTPATVLARLRQQQHRSL